MTLVALRLVVVGLLCAGCSINHRSDQFACEKPSDCSSGRSCIDGFCVAAQVDSGVKDGNTTCPVQCTSCASDAKVCVIDCAANPSACNLPVTCPTGWSCQIACSTPNACRNGINCAGGQSCTVTCSGKEACQNVLCGPGSCKVDCTGPSSCVDIRCGAACACDVTCSLDARCERLVCKGPRCVSPLRGCTSSADGCNTCP